MIDLQTFGLSVGVSLAGIGGILKILVRSEAKEALAPEIEKLHGRINKVEDNYVSKEHCQTQHINSEKNFEKMDNKLDIILAAILKNKE